MHREVSAEGSRRQNTTLMNKNHMRQYRRMRRPISLKSEIYPEGGVVYVAGMSVEVSAHYPGNGSEADIDYRR